MATCSGASSCSGFEEGGSGQVWEHQGLASGQGLYWWPA